LVTQFYRDGEALLYPRFGEAMGLFRKNIRNIVLNGKLLVEKAEEVIGNLETLSISIFENDEEAEEQYDIITKFLEIKKDRKPFVSLRLLGDVDNEPFLKFNQLIIRRVLHSPMGCFNYRKKQLTIPEIGICWDFLQHPCINVYGNFSIYVRFDPKGLEIIGYLEDNSLEDLWNGPVRQEWMEKHVSGSRSAVPLCSYCEYWGVPIGP
jgi:hypothetical protein